MSDRNQKSIQYALKHGKRYEPALSPQDVTRGRVGDCYDTCVLNALKQKYRYVEGIAQNPMHPDQWMPHAWLTDGKFAYDPTWRAVINDKEAPVPTMYIGFEIPIEAIARFMTRTKYKSILANAWRSPELAKECIPSLPEELLTKLRPYDNENSNTRSWHPDSHDSLDLPRTVGLGRNGDNR